MRILGQARLRGVRDTTHPELCVSRAVVGLKARRRRAARLHRQCRASPVSGSASVGYCECLGIAADVRPAVV